MAVNIIEGGSDLVIYEPQERSDKSAQRDLIGEEGEGSVLIPRYIYSKLGNLSNNKVIVKSEDEKNEYEMFLGQMEELGYALYEGIDLSEMPEGIISIDEYLGSLGLTKDYPFLDDKYDLSAWIDFNSQSDFRNIKADIEGIDYNVIARVEGIDYNVIHNTKKLTTGAQNAG